MRVLKENAPIVIIAALTVLAFAGVVYFASKSATTNVNEVDPAILSDNTYFRGTAEASASATLIEFSDFQCPACGAYYPIVKELETRYAGKLKVGYKHFPLSQHPYAQKAAEAAEAAGAQGKFWEMHDIMFENQTALTIDDLKKYAKQLGLNMEQFSSDLESAKYAEKVNKDLTLGIKVGVDGTPTFFLDGKRLRPQSGQELDSLIGNYLNSKK